MKHLFGAAVTIALALTGLDAAAHHYSVGDLVIDHPWARPNPLPGRPGAAYAVIHNNGDNADRLLEATSPAFGRIEIHKHVIANGVAKMEKQTSLFIPSGDARALEPGGLHLMLFHAVKPLVDGDRFPMTLRFERTGDVEVEVYVTEPTDVIRKNGLTLNGAYIRANIMGRPSAAYVSIGNNGAADDRLIGAASDAFGRIELHEHVMANGAMSMRKIDGMDAPKGGNLELAPGGLHFMLFDPNIELKPGTRLPMTLNFAVAGPVEATFEVRAIGDKTGQDHGDHDHSDQSQ